MIAAAPKYLVGKMDERQKTWRRNTLRRNAWPIIFQILKENQSERENLSCIMVAPKLF